MDILFLSLYSLTAFIHILSIQRERSVEKPTGSPGKSIVRFVSKTCLMPILLFYYVSKSDAPSFTIITAMIFSWFGDILLFNPGKIRLYAGILSFLAAHILYIVVFVGLIPELNVLIFFVSFLLILSIEFFLMIRLRIPNNYKFSISIYGIAIGLLVAFSLQVFIWYKSMASILLFTGAILFFISDAVLSYFTMIKPMTKNSLTIVMATYSIAQACIVIGCVNFLDIF